MVVPTPSPPQVLLSAVQHPQQHLRLEQPQHHSLAPQLLHPQHQEAFLSPSQAQPSGHLVQRLLSVLLLVPSPLGVQQEPLYQQHRLHLPSVVLVRRSPQQQQHPGVL